MFAPPMPADEDRRIEALKSLGLLDTPPESRFDRISRLACCVANTPIALVCLVDRHRQWFKSRQGIESIETPREVSFCGHTILQDEPLIIPDTIEDPRFADNPLVIGSPHARFYAGHPIRAPEGARVGTLCVMDTRPRTLKAREIESLADLAAMVDSELLSLRFNIATRAAGVGVHERDTRGGDMWWSEAMWDIFGRHPATFRPSLAAWIECVHPDDREYVRANAGSVTQVRTAPSLQYRIVRPDGTVRHLKSIASTTEGENALTTRIAGITLDVTARVEFEDRKHGQQRKLREISHQAGMAQVATGVLHGVGNVLNSLGIANATARRDLKALRLDRLTQAAVAIRDNLGSIASFLNTDERGRHIPEYLLALSAQLSSGAHEIQTELDTTDHLLQHMGSIVSAQLAHAHVILREPLDLKEKVEIALDAMAADRSVIEVIRRYGDVPPVISDRHKLLLILTGLVKNAVEAIGAGASQPGRIVVELQRDGDHAVISIGDSGIGMSSEVLSRLWRFGFTTKPAGQGFGLHNGANAAREIGATISAHSDGLNRGSVFRVRLPIHASH